MNNMFSRDYKPPMKACQITKDVKYFSSTRSNDVNKLILGWKLLCNDSGCFLEPIILAPIQTSLQVHQEILI